MSIIDNGRFVEIHSSTYPEDIMGIKRISTDEYFGCIVCIKSDRFNENDYIEYEIPEESEEEE